MTDTTRKADPIFTENDMICYWARGVVVGVVVGLCLGLAIGWRLTHG